MTPTHSNIAYNTRTQVLNLRIAAFVRIGLTVIQRATDSTFRVLAPVGTPIDIVKPHTGNITSLTLDNSPPQAPQLLIATLLRCFYTAPTTFQNPSFRRNSLYNTALQ